MSLDFLDQVEQNLSISKVGIVEFCEGADYCNKPLYPRQKILLKLIFLEELTEEEDKVLDYWIAGGRGGEEIKISPDIRERIQYLRDNGFSHFREIILVGGRRSSKGFVTGMAMGKKMWDTLQFQDPGSHYGIDKDKEIFFSCVAGSEQQAKEFQFADLSSTIESCKAFEPYLVKALETEIRVATSEDLRKVSAMKTRGQKIVKDVARLRGKALAANAGTLRGSTSIALCIDEMAHMIPGESKASADQVYSAAEPSLDQFGQDGIIFLNSSPYSKVGKFYERFVEALNIFDPELEPNEIIDEDHKNGDPMIFTFEFPSWALFEGYQDDPEHRFSEVITASADWDPEEKNEDGSSKWSQGDRAKIRIAKAQESANPDTYKVERRGKFAEVTDAYLNPEMVDRAFQGVPFGKDENGKILLQPFRTNLGQGATNLYRYKAHLDPSSTTAGFGFALGHVERFEDVTGFMQDHVVFDIVKRWNPKDFPGDTIVWKTVIDEVILYADIFRPYEISFDQFQSHEPIQSVQQQLMEKGISGIIVREIFATNETNWHQAETFKTALNHALVHAPYDCLAIEPYGPEQELKFLQKKNTGGKYPRVDRQTIGPVQTKDMADCMMNVVEALIGNVIAQQMHQRAAQAVMATGAAGGYPIGGNQQRPKLADMHPDLAGYYGSKRNGEQRYTDPERPSYKTVMGRGRRGINRTGGRSPSRGRF